MKTFMREWISLAQSGTGERGMFYRVAAQRKAAENGRRDIDHDFGTNPCSEIILRPYQFCNLSEIIVRGADTVEQLQNKVRIATIIGTWQSTMTNFPYLRRIWKKNTEEERLLGVSMTGIMDNSILNGSDPMYGGSISTTLQELKQVAVQTNEELAKEIGIRNLLPLPVLSLPALFPSLLILPQVFMHDIVSTTSVRSEAIRKTLLHSL